MSLSGVVVTLRDVTAWREAESALRTSEARFRALIEHAQDVVGIVGLDGVVQYESPAVERVLGVTPEALVGREVTDLVHPDDLPAVTAALAALARAPGSTVPVAYRTRHADGSWRMLEGAAWNLANDPAVGGVVVNVRDVTDRAVSEAALRRSEERFRALSASSPVGIFEADHDGHLTYVNPRMEQIWGVSDVELLGDGWTVRVHPDERPTVVEGWRAALAAHSEYEVGFRVLHASGETRFVRGHAAPLRDATGAVVGAVGTMKDLTPRCRATEALAESEARLRLALSAGRMAVWEFDLQTEAMRPDVACEDPNPATGEVPDDLGIPATFAAFLNGIHPDDRARIESAGAHALATGADIEEEFRVVLPDGAVRWRHIRGRAVAGPGGGPARLVGVGTDTTDRKSLEESLVHQARHDALTGLANRTLFRERVLRALADTSATGAPVHGRGGDRFPAVLLVDLDNFKTVNDSLGHAAGDHLLTVATARLLDATRGSDTVARLGGDEFAILLDGVRDHSEAAVVSDRVVAALTAPFALDGRDVRVGASVGIAFARAGDDPEALLRNADLALYRAKAAGKGRSATFVPAMHAAAVERLELEAELRCAVANGDLTVHYQPVVSLETGAVTGAEALVRWPHPERGLVPPSTFIPIAESAGLIVPLGGWVLEEACRAAAGWATAGIAGADALTVAVNVSALQFQHPTFVRDVEAAVVASGLPPCRLVLEVTESVVLSDLDAAICRLEELRALGVGLALDDFGTGYSSLAYLQRLPLDVLKIDRAFIAELCADGKSAALARAVVTFADALELRTVAEGVETAAQHLELARLGCGFGQGYLYSRPLEPAALVEYIRAHHPRVLTK